MSTDKKTLIIGYLFKHPALKFLPMNKLQDLAEEICYAPLFNRFYNTVSKLHNGNEVDAQEVMSLAIDIASTADISIKEGYTVLFSGVTQKQAENLVACTDKYNVIHSRPAGAMLEMLNLFSQPSTIRKEHAYLPWYILAIRLTESARGDVTAIIDQPLPEKTFRSIELSILIENENVTSINGRNKNEFKQLVSASRKSLESAISEAKSTLNKLPVNKNHLNNNQIKAKRL